MEGGPPRSLLGQRVKAVVVPQRGGPEVLHIQEVSDATAGPGQILVRIAAVGVNFADHLIRIGAYATGDPPVIPGLEAAGVVEALGPDADTELRPGDRVIAWGRPTYAELAAFPSWAVLPAPAGLSFEELAAIPVAFGTAWHALRFLADAQRGEWVLVHAVGSGVGSAALQAAKYLGARVVATAGQDWKLARARELGADATVNYATEDVADGVRRATDGAGVNVVLEGVGKATFAASVSCMAEEGRLIIYGAPSGPRVELDARLAIWRNLSLLGMSVSTSPRFRESIRLVQADLIPGFESGQLRPIIDAIFPLEAAADAHRRLMDRAQFGKLILRVADLGA